jgi:hypothetical protein
MSEAARGQIHDLGYKRYVGTRRPSSTRWRVIMREQVANGWKKWWRYKLALGGAVITLCIAGGMLFFMTNDVVDTFGSMGNGRGAQLVLTFADAIVPLAIPFFCRTAFILSLTLGAAIIANDTQSGAFTFYYVRSIRPRDYVFGKLAGYGLLVGSLVLVGPLLLACFRIGMSSDSDQFVHNLSILGKVLAIGALATVAYTTVPLAISALVPNRRYALALWAAYYLIVGNIALAVGTVSKSALAAVDIQTSVTAMTTNLFDLTILRGHPLFFGMWPAVISLVGQSVLAIGIIWFQVSRDQRHGVGGAS